MIPTLRGIILGMVTIVPWLLLAPLGLLWLWQNGYLYPWLTLAAAITGIAWLWHRWQPAREHLHKPSFEPDQRWADRDLAVWTGIQQQVDSIRVEDYPLDGRLAHRLLDLGLGTIRTVARNYHPAATEPELSVSLPHVLRSVELVCRDLRRLTDYVPLSHLITLGQWKRAPGLVRLAQLYDGWRLARLVINPASALMAELRGVVQGRLLTYSRDELQLWLLREFIRGTARHAIDLYSGNLPLDEGESRPFRLVVLGQSGSGKTSLLRALFGPEPGHDDDRRADEAGSDPAVRYPDLPHLTVLDSAGYGGEARVQPSDRQRSLLDADLVLLVCAAHQVAREPDNAMLEYLRQTYRSHPGRASPALVCALTHIDRLRPLREWSPPYDIVHGEDTKAANIRAAVKHVAGSLGMQADQVVPVRCDPGHGYNIDEALVPRILAALEGDSVRARYLRTLGGRKRAEDWGRILNQAVNAGRVLGAAAVRAGRAAVGIEPPRPK